jgi:hypothetical protein
VNWARNGTEVKADGIAEYFIKLET